jgi:hypothetical protein
MEAMSRRVIYALLGSAMLACGVGVLWFVYAGKVTRVPVEQVESGITPLPTTAATLPKPSFVLHDIQGLWGGRAIWAASDGSATVQVVGKPPAGQSGMWEKRFKIQVTAEQQAEIARLVGAHDFLHLRIKERPGIPDESHPLIVVVTKEGITAKVWKWASDKHPDFDPLYEYLLAICQSVQGQQLEREGAFDWEWRPPGFDRLW